MMQRQHRHRPLPRLRRPCREAFDRVVVGGQRGDARLRDPLQQPLVAAVERAAAVMQRMRIGPAAHLQHHLGEAGAQHQDIAGLDGDPIGVHHAHQVVVADGAELAAEVHGQIDQHAAALHTMYGQCLDAERVGVAVVMSARMRGEIVGLGIVHRSDDLGVGPEAVVVDAFGHTVAVGIEQRADMGQRIPLRRILQGQQHLVVAEHVERIGVDLGQREIDVGNVVAIGGPKHRRMPAHVQRIAARQIEWQRQAERAAAANLLRGGADLVRGDQIQTAELVVRAEIAPVGAFRSLFPSHRG